MHIEKPLNFSGFFVSITTNAIMSYFRQKSLKTDAFAPSEVIRKIILELRIE